MLRRFLVGVLCVKPRDRTGTRVPSAAAQLDARSPRHAVCERCARRASSRASRGPMAPPFAIKLLASHTLLSMPERPTFTVGVEVANQGAITADPQLASTCELAVNGNTSLAWNFAVNDNRQHDQHWSQLPPGKTVTMSRHLGVWLFPRPGTYRLVLTVAGHEAVADVQVTS